MKRGDDLIEIRKIFILQNMLKKMRYILKMKKNDYLIYSEDKIIVHQSVISTMIKELFNRNKKKYRTKIYVFKKIECMIFFLMAN